jgi:hypothetical protein
MVLQGEKSKILLLLWSGTNEESFLIDSNFSLCPYMMERVRDLSGVALVRLLIWLVGPLLSWPNHLLISSILGGTNIDTIVFKNGKGNMLMLTKPKHALELTFAMFSGCLALLTTIPMFGKFLLLLVPSTQVGNWKLLFLAPLVVTKSCWQHGIYASYY